MENELSIKLQLDETQHVTGYVTVGDLDGSVDYTGTIPDGFIGDPQVGRYQLINGQLEVDSNYVEPTPDVVKYQPSEDQRFQAQLALQVATMQKNQAEFNAQVLLQLADLKKSETPASPVASSAAATPSAPVASEATSEATATTATVESK